MKDKSRHYLLTPIGLTVLLVTIVVFATAVHYGYTRDPDEFLLSASTEIAGIAISLLIGILIVDNFTAYRNRKQWHAVRKQAFRAIIQHVTQIMIYAYVFFLPDPSNPLIGTIRETPKPSQEAIDEMGKFVTAVQDLDNTEERTTLSNISKEVYKESQVDAQKIIDIWMPRIIDFAPDEHLVEMLIEFDDAYLSLANVVALTRQISDYDTFGHLVVYLRQALSLYETIAEQWDK